MSQVTTATPSIHSNATTSTASTTTVTTPPVPVEINFSLLAEMLVDYQHLFYINDTTRAPMAFIRKTRTSAG